MAVKTPAPMRSAGRKKLAAAGNALPDGSFPIPNVSYLKKAIRAVGRTKAGKRPALARLIRKRAGELGSAGQAVLKGSWADNTQPVKAMANALYGQLIECGLTRDEAVLELSRTLPLLVVELAGSKAVTQQWDPDGDNDNDADPSEDTDNDYAGKLTGKQKAVYLRLVNEKKWTPERAYKFVCNMKMSGAAA